jgi:hypothetical protein
VATGVRGCEGKCGVGWGGGEPRGTARFDDAIIQSVNPPTEDERTNTNSFSERDVHPPPTPSTARSWAMLDAMPSQPDLCRGCCVLYTHRRGLGRCPPIPAVLDCGDPLLGLRQRRVVVAYVPSSQRQLTTRVIIHPLRSSGSQSRHPDKCKAAALANTSSPYFLSLSLLHIIDISPAPPQRTHTHTHALRQRVSSTRHAHRLLDHDGVRGVHVLNGALRLQLRAQHLHEHALVVVVAVGLAKVRHRVALLEGLKQVQGRVGPTPAPPARPVRCVTHTHVGPHTRAHTRAHTPHTHGPA